MADGKHLASPATDLVLPSTTTHPSAWIFERFGIRPEENPTIFMEMPSLLDHRATVESYKTTVKEVQTEEHEIIGTRLAGTSDFVIPNLENVKQPLRGGMGSSNE